MRRLKHEMFAAVDHLPFLFGIIAPQHKNKVLPLVGQRTHCGVSKAFPTFALMRTGLVCPYRQRGI